MNIFSIILTIAGLFLFETVGSIDNAIINAQVLSTMGEKAKKWFLTWGILFSVFVIRGILPWLIIFLVNPSLGPIGAFTATFNQDPSVKEAIAKAAPILLIGGGTFLIFLFFNWLFLEEKHFGLYGERFFARQGIWFFAMVSIILSVFVWIALQVHPMLALGAVIGSTAFFIVHGFRENAEKQEEELLHTTTHLLDTSKIFYLMVIDATFSMDEVLGAFAFTLSVPLILLGTGLGAIVVRQLTVSNIERIKKYVYLENGAMYAILFLGVVMVLESFGTPIPSWISPIITFLVIGYFFFKSKAAINV